MKSWLQRPFELKTLFNPAFCGVVLSRVLAGYEEEKADGMPFSLVLLVLPLCLHKETRLILSANSRGYVGGRVLDCCMPPRHSLAVPEEAALRVHAETESKSSGQMGTR
ncbi:three component ABC system middle component [Terracidiphilus sp.]|jgi:hypothetical protein|uniref:three component ABC system middle component n=1 Tax=Terracidiphilus sp. TaxID=1964191 RepID=UPI003C78E421